MLLPWSSNSSTSCIRPQRLYSPALRPPLLDRADSIRPSQFHTSTERSRSQGLPENLDIYLYLYLDYRRYTNPDTIE